MKTQTFINRYQVSGRWRPGMDMRRWLEPMEILVKEQSEAIELQRQHGFMENSALSKNGEDFEPPVHYHEARKITAMQQYCQCYIDDEDIFRYELRTDIHFDETSVG